MKDNPVLVLQPYRLDLLLTDEDDPHLWAAAVSKHWPKPNALSLWKPILFGVGQILSEEAPPFFYHLSGMMITEEWRLERTSDGSLTPVPVKGAASRKLYPWYILHVTRPSAGRASAIVHAGSNPAPLIGGGESRVWKRRAATKWIETKKVVSSWVT